MSPPSGLKKPAARLSRVVLPQPEGPSSVMNSPRRIDSVTWFSAKAAPKRLVTASNRTATSSLGEMDACPAMVLSVALFNIQHLPQTQEGVGKYNQPGSAGDVQPRKRRHRR